MHLRSSCELRMKEKVTPFLLLDAVVRLAQGGYSEKSKALPADELSIAITDQSGLGARVLAPPYNSTHLDLSGSFSMKGSVMHRLLAARRGVRVALCALLGLLGSPRSGLPNDTRPCMLQNSALRLTLCLGPKGITARSFENKLTGQTMTLPCEEFSLEFADGGKISSKQLKARLLTANESQVELLFSDISGGLEVRVQHRLATQAHYTRKQISLRQKSGTSRRLVRAELENWQQAPGNWETLHGDRFPFGSHPVFCDGVWAGVEFVAAFNQVEPDGFTLCSRPGKPLIRAEWVDLHSTVVGMAPSGGVRDAFLRYIDDIRLAPPRMVACYNSWWTLPTVVKQRDNLVLICELKEAMFDKHGMFFDIITTDMGWSKLCSIWEIDRSILPQGFDDIRAIVEPAGGKLGIWMSPSEIYPPVCDYDWAEKAGYAALRPQRDHLPGQRAAAATPASRWPVSNFDYAGPLTEIVLLGVLALRALRPAARVEYREHEDQDRPADSFIHSEYRQGWTL